MWLIDCPSRVSAMSEVEDRMKVLLAIYLVVQLVTVTTRPTTTATPQHTHY